MASKTTSKSLPAARCVRQNIICVEPRSHISHSAEGLCIQRRSAPSLPAAMLPALITACIFRQNHGDSTVTVRLQSYGDSTVIERLQHGPCMVPARSLHGPCTVIAKFGPSAVTVMHGHSMVQSQSGTGTVTDRSTWSWSGTCSVLVWSVIGVRLVSVRWRHLCTVAAW